MSTNTHAETMTTPSKEQKSAYVRKTRAGNYQASMKLEGIYTDNSPAANGKNKLIMKYKRLAAARG